MVTAIFVGLLAVLILAFASMQALLGNLTTQQRVVRQVLEPGRGARTGWLRKLELALGRTRPGRRLREELRGSGLDYPLYGVLAAGLLLTVFVPYLLWVYVAPLIAVAGVFAGWLALRAWLRHQRNRYRDRFVDQIPDLARVLSNATSAGLSIRTAWLVAEREMEQPAQREITRINTAVRFGASLEDAMMGVEERLPSREVKVLMSTLAIASRSGGSLVRALRDISYMLDERKETKREVRTTMAQAVATGYTLVFIGVGVLLLINAVMPGTIERMTQSIFGIIALAVGLSMLGGGLLLIRRITRIDL